MKGLECPWDLTCWKSALYVSCTKGKIYHIELYPRICVNCPGGNRAKSIISWCVIGDDRASLSTNTHGNLLAACEQTSKLYEYTPNGSMLREIALPSSITKPQRAVQIKEDRFLVCQIEGRNLHRVCLIDNQGHLLKSYGSAQGSGTGQLNEPYRIVVLDRDGFILVADSMNRRVILLNIELEYVKDLIPRSENNLNILEVFLHGKKIYVSNSKSSVSYLSIFDLC